MSTDLAYELIELDTPDGPKLAKYIPKYNVYEEPDPADYESFYGPDTEHGMDTPTGALVIEHFADIAARVDAMPAPTFLACPVWPSDAYGIIAAENKAGKSWAAIDLAVNVAAGGKWLGAFECQTPGPVVFFAGEGSDRKTVRRVRAVAEHYGIDPNTLPLRVCHRVPHLSNLEHLGELHHELQRTRPALVVVDPLYLAARGADASRLIEMGALLENAQHAAQSVGAALVVVHHWNKSGSGTDRSRFSGAGSAEWGRVLVSVAVQNRRTDDKTKATSVTLEWQFLGDEIPDTTLRMVREVWCDDPDDLSSPMRYRATLLDDAQRGGDEWDGPTHCMAAIEHLLGELGSELSKNQLAQELRDRGQSYRNDIVRQAAELLATQGRIRVRNGSRNSRMFSALPDDRPNAIEGL